MQGRRNPNGKAGGGVIVPQDFGRSVNSTSIREQIMPTTLLLNVPPPDFQTFLWPFYVQHLNSIAL